MNQSSYELHLGDCLEVMKGMPDNSVDAVITDPSYSLPNSQFRPKARISQRTFGEFSTQQYFFGAFLDECIRLLSDGGDIYLFCDEVFYAVLYPLFYSRFYSTKLIVWDKGRIGMGGAWRRQFELIIHARLAPFPKKSGDSDIVLCAPVKEKQHQSQKPEELITKFIQKNPGATGKILDSFMGSGTTGVCALKEGRNFIGIEIDPDYYKVAEKRIELAHSQLRLGI